MMFLPVSSPIAVEWQSTYDDRNGGRSGIRTHACRALEPSESLKVQSFLPVRFGLHQKTQRKTSAKRSAAWRCSTRLNFHHRVNFPDSVLGQSLSPVRSIFWCVADVPRRFSDHFVSPLIIVGRLGRIIQLLEAIAKK